MMLRLKTISRSACNAARPIPVRSAPFRVRWSATHMRSPLAVRAAGGVEGYVVKPITSTEELEAERIWLATALTTWLDEEWTTLAEHQQLGKAAADAYVGLRQQGENDMGAVVLAVASELLRPELSAAFRASFTDPFEVSNKLVETVMLRDGCDVCCTSQDDRDRIRRVDQLISSGSGSSMD